MRVGLWLIGACGSVGATVSLGLAALKRGLASDVGLVTQSALCEGLDLAAPGDFVVGGHEIRPTTLAQAVEELHLEAGLFSPDLIAATKPLLRTWQKNIRPGTLLGANSLVQELGKGGGQSAARSAAEAVEILADDLRAFRVAHKLSRVVVVNVASAESATASPGLLKAATVDRLLEHRDVAGLPTSSVYALAAARGECSYVNFTPSLGMDVPAIRRAAMEAGICYMGKDGKTGETLLKSVLAPMFAARNLQVLSWVGHNMLGNRDGMVLQDPASKAAKIKSKDHLLGAILGYSPQTVVSIEFVESLHDWKTAWDFIHFRGFLDAKMTLQFTWHASDSILAAPLVIDLARLTELHARRGKTGLMPHLACFFKSPTDVTIQDFSRQFAMLQQYLNEARSRP